MTGSGVVEHSALPQSGKASQQLFFYLALKGHGIFIQSIFHVSVPQVANVPIGMTLELPVNLSV